LLGPRREALTPPLRPAYPHRRRLGCSRSGAVRMARDGAPGPAQ